MADLPISIFIILISSIVFWCSVSFLCPSCIIKEFLIIIFFVFLAVPLIYKYSYSVQKTFLFFNFVSWPWPLSHLNVNLSQPESVGLNATRNFYITENDVKLGVWHILPKSLINNATEKIADDKQYEEWLSNGLPIIVYAHGNSGARGARHRVELYQVLRQNDYHVITFDYRGYGDSSAVPIDETGLVDDTISIYKWVLKRTTNSSVFIWGHSLGTGISSHALKVLHAEDKEPKGLVLEAPFNNLKDEVTEHPFSQIFRIFPWFDYFFTTPMYENGLRFESDKNLENVTCSILILHAKDDRIVPYKLGLKLYKTVLGYRNNSTDKTQMISFEEDKHYGHKFICHEPTLPHIIETFMQKSTPKNVTS